MSFVDTMLIPKGAKNLAQAHAWMNFLYDPAVSGPLFEKINYVSPVQGANANMTEKARKNVLINPPASAKIAEFRDSLRFITGRVSLEAAALQLRCF